MKYLGGNFTTPLYQDINFRKALAHAIDRDEAILAGFEGEAYSIASFVPPSTWGFAEEQNVYAKEHFTYDPELAKQILDEAGIKDSNGDGVREFQGKEIDLQFSVSTSEDVKRVAEPSSHSWLRLVSRSTWNRWSPLFRQRCWSPAAGPLHQGLWVKRRRSLRQWSNRNRTCMDDPKAIELADIVTQR